MAGKEDRLSALDDDILRRILRFVPSKEAASTSVLSRRWRSLWRSSGAVNLALRLNDETAIFSRREAFLRAARAALDAAAAPVTRLNLRLETAGDSAMYTFLHPSGDNSLGTHGYAASEQRAAQVMRAVVSHPALRRLEELRFAAVVGADADEQEPSNPTWNYGIGPLLRSSNSSTLRVLDLTRCWCGPPNVAFPRLKTLRLRRCSLPTRDLQALIGAAPRLATMHLQSVFFQNHLTVARLRCPTATDLVLELCGMDGHRCQHGDNGSIETDAPRLRYFRYKGAERRFSLSSPAPDIARVDLHFLPLQHYNFQPRCAQAYPSDKDATRALFWTFVRNFAGVRDLKLKVNCLEDIAVGKTRWNDVTELPCTFGNAVRLELEGAHDPTSKKAALDIANLLRCCPVLRDLRLNLTTVQSGCGSTGGQSFLEKKDRLDYDRSVHLFTRRRRLNPMFLNDNDTYDEVADLPGLTEQSFTCLQTSLTRVGMQFPLGNSRCLGVQLVKFFADNAQVLDEICVDTGNWKLCEHMNLNVERWIAPTSSKACLKRKNLAENSWEFSKVPRVSSSSKTEHKGLASTSFTVLPLQR